MEGDVAQLHSRSLPILECQSALAQGIMSVSTRPFVFVVYFHVAERVITLAFDRSEV